MSEIRKVPDPHGSMVRRLIETDHAGRVLYATPEAAQLFATSRHQIVGQDVFRLFGEDGPTLRGHLESVILGRRVQAIPAMLSAEKNASVPVFIRAESVDGRTVRWRIVKREDARGEVSTNF